MASLSTVAVRDDAAVAVAGVLAEADVGDDEERGVGLLEGAHRLLDDAVGRVGLTGLLVLRRGYAEEEDGGNAELAQLLGLGGKLVDGELRLAGHRRDGVADAEPCTTNSG